MELKKDYVLDQVKKIRDSIESWRIKCKYNCQHSKRNHSLKIKYPRFSATAKINLPPLKKGECWEIGWVQGIEDQDFVMWYSNQGYYSFELPQLNKGNSFIIDSMGRKMPWYDDFIVKQGPTERKSSLEVVMHDQPTAEIPVRVGKGDLQWIYRRTKFRVWLVAKLAAKPTMHTLKMCTWLLETTVRKENNEWVKTVIQKDPINLEMIHLFITTWQKSSVAQWKRAGPITQRSMDRNHPLLSFFSIFFHSFYVMIKTYTLFLYISLDSSVGRAEDCRGIECRHP